MPAARSEYKSNTALAFWRGQAGNLFLNILPVVMRLLLTEKPIRLQPAGSKEIIQLQTLAFPEQRFIHVPKPVLVRWHSI